MAETTTTTASKTRSAAGKKAAATRKTNATRRSTAAKKGVATRKRTQATANARKAVKAETTEVKTTVDRVQDVAEKAVLVPVGAALVARDRVVEVAGDLLETYSDREKAERELRSGVRTAERRGVKARNQAERRVRRTRTQIERELRTRRTRVEREVRKTRRDAEKQLKSLDKQVAPVREQFELAQARAENLVQSGITAGTEAVAIVTERIASAA